MRKANGAKGRGLLAPCPMRLLLCFGTVDCGECGLDGFLIRPGLSGKEVVELFLGHGSPGLLVIGLALGGLGGLVLLKGYHKVIPFVIAVEHEPGELFRCGVIGHSGIPDLGELNDFNIISGGILGGNKFLESFLPLAHCARLGQEVHHFNGFLARPDVGFIAVEHYGFIVTRTFLLFGGVLPQVLLSGGGGDNTVSHVLLQLLTGYVDYLKEFRGGQGADILTGGLVIVDLTGGGQGVGVGPLDSECGLCVVSHAGEAVSLVKLFDLDLGQDRSQSAVLVLGVVLSVQIELRNTLGGLVQGRVYEFSGLVGDGKQSVGSVHGSFSFQYS